MTVLHFVYGYLIFGALLTGLFVTWNTVWGQQGIRETIRAWSSLVSVSLFGPLLLVLAILLALWIVVRFFYRKMRGPQTPPRPT